MIIKKIMFFFLFQAECEDPDPGFDGDLVYVISGGDSDSIFNMNTTTGVVYLIGEADRERRSEYWLNVTACDQGTTPAAKCSTILAHVVVRDENDNAPVFMKSAFSFFFPENTRNGTPVVTLNATDKDSGNNFLLLKMKKDDNIHKCKASNLDGRTNEY